jgi:chemotaxis protein histidine kinase CheA
MSASAKPAPRDNPEPAYGRFERIVPPRMPNEIAKYRDIKGSGVDPVENAERQLSLLSVDFQQWLDDDRRELVEAWAALSADPSDPAAFKRFHRIVHTICGNAAILECEAAGILAKPLTRLLERAPDIAGHTAMIGPAVDAIAAAVSRQTSMDDPKFEEIRVGLDKIVAKWISRKR